MSATPELELEQKALRTKISYRFFADYLEYTLRDAAGGAASFKVPYASLPSGFHYGLYQAPWKRLVGMQLFAVMFLGVVAISIYPRQPHPLFEFSIIGMFAFAASALLEWRFRKTYTSVPVPNNRMLVLRGRRHDEVIEALESRRLRTLRKLAVIEPRNSPQAELQKFTWLKAQGVISDKELEFFRQKVLAAEDLKSPPPAKPPSETVQ
jgi:hypothetical protein